jgi:hypothetical protein
MGLDCGADIQSANSAHDCDMSDDKPPVFFIPGDAPEEQEKVYAPWQEVTRCMCLAQANGFTRSAIATIATCMFPIRNEHERSFALSWRMV